MRRLLLLSMMLLAAAPNCLRAADSDEMSERERQSFEQRFRRGAEPELQLPFLQAAPVVPGGETPMRLPPKPYASRLSSGAGQRPSTALAGENSDQPAATVSQLVAIPRTPSIKLLPDLPTVGALAALPFNLTYEGLRDRDTDCVPYHERLSRTARERFEHLCGPVQDWDIGVQSRIEGAGVPAFTTR